MNLPLPRALTHLHPDLCPLGRQRRHLGGACRTCHLPRLLQSASGLNGAASAGTGRQKKKRLNVVDADPVTGSAFARCPGIFSSRFFYSYLPRPQLLNLHSTSRLRALTFQACDDPAHHELNCRHATATQKPPFRGRPPSAPPPARLCQMEQELHATPPSGLILEPKWLWKMVCCRPPCICKTKFWKQTLGRRI